MPLDAYESHLLGVVPCVARPSNLSKQQVLEAQRLLKHFYPKLILQTVFLKSRGDLDKETSLRGLELTNFFTDVLDQALLQNEARLAVHSAKDLPSPLMSGLIVAAITPCIDSRDALVLREGLDPTQQLPQNLRVATSSQRRESAVRQLCQTATFQDLRGTIEERLALLQPCHPAHVDGVVVAQAALIRLQLQHLPHLYLPGPTTPGQGSLALVIREDDYELLQYLQVIDSRQNRPRSYYLGLDPRNYLTPFPLHHCPVIFTNSWLENNPLLQKQALTYLEKATHVLLTSPRSAHYLWQTIVSSKTALEEALQKTWLCIGPSTAKELGPQAQKLCVCPEGSSAEDLIPRLQQLQNAHIFYPRSLQARALLANFLEQNQIIHSNLVIYETCSLSLNLDTCRILQQADELIFSSPSCVYSFFDQVKPSSRTKLTTLGPITDLALQKYHAARYTATHQLSSVNA